MGITPLAFTGISKFSDDFQTILNRSLSIAALPVQALQNEQATLLQKKQVSGALNGQIANLTNRLTALANLGEKRALAATSSDPSKVAVTNSGASAAATYTISDITSLAKAASETSLAGFADGSQAEVSPTGRLRLTFGEPGKESIHEVTLEAGKNNLAGLREAINKLNAGVSASVLTTGTGATPNYLSISANTPGAVTLKLEAYQTLPDPDNPEADPPALQQLLTSSNQGADTVFKLNGLEIRKKSTFINDVAPGLTFSVLGLTDAARTPPETISLTLSSSRAPIADAFRAFVADYNAAAAAANQQIGPAAGLLSGDTIVREIKDVLRQITSYEGSGSIKSLAAIGLTLSREGEMSFDQSALDRLSDAQIQGVLDFLGNSTSGFGLLAKKAQAISDPVMGMIKIQQDQYDRADARLTEQIGILTERITQTQAALSAKLRAADVLLARLDSQQTVLEASLESVRLALFGKKDN